jgi:membrane associated rhomboid family serine protease
VAVFFHGTDIAKDFKKGMAIPIGDDDSLVHTRPVINYLLILLNIFVFIYWQQWGQNIHLTFGYATVPKEILSGTDIITSSKTLTDPLTGEVFDMPGLQRTPVNVYLTLITSMFLHGGIAHLFGNMLFLWVFGDNIENAMGHLRYLFFYLLCGVLAGLAHVFSVSFFGQNQLIPSIGASGAISGVLGAYIILFPTNAVRVWIFLFIVRLPAFLVVGLWFVFQVLNGLGALGGEEAGGVAYAAHVGGFIAGMLLVKLFVGREFVHPVRARVRRF